MLPEDRRRRREVTEISSDDLVAATELAAQLMPFNLDLSTDTSIGLWLFKAREELAARGELLRIRDHMPWWIPDPERYQAEFQPRYKPADRPRAALPAPASTATTRTPKAIPGQPPELTTGRDT